MCVCAMNTKMREKMINGERSPLNGLKLLKGGAVDEEDEAGSSSCKLWIVLARWMKNGRSRRKIERRMKNGRSRIFLSTRDDLRLRQHLPLHENSLLGREPQVGYK